MRTAIDENPVCLPGSRKIGQRAQGFFSDCSFAHQTQSDQCIAQPSSYKKNFRRFAADSKIPNGSHNDCKALLAVIFAISVCGLGFLKFKEGIRTYDISIY
jgi:hypothetical protein